MTLPNLSEMIDPFYYCSHFVNGSLYHVGPPYRCCCYFYYYYYCCFCTVLIAGFLVLHSSSLFSLFLLYSLFPPAPHSLSKQLLPFLDIPELVTQISPMCQRAPHRERTAFVLVSQVPLRCHCRGVGVTRLCLHKPTGLGGKCLI